MIQLKHIYKSTVRIFKFQVDLNTYFIEVLNHPGLHPTQSEICKAKGNR